MPRIMETEQSKQVPVEWYRPGISFANAKIYSPAAKIRSAPWIAMNWASPLTIVRRGTPNNELENMKILKIRRPYWRRKYKNKVLVRLTHGGHEINSFDEMGLGEVPVAAERSPTSLRTSTGFVRSTLEDAETSRQSENRLQMLRDRIRESQLGQEEQETEKKDSPKEGILTGATLIGLTLIAYVASAKPKARWR